MSKQAILTLLALGVAVIAAGCIFDPETEEVSVETGEYSKALTHPDSLINDLEVSYRRREIIPYARLLGNEFIFHFLPEDAGDIPNGEWNKDEDSTGTYNLFNDVAVTRITIDLQWFPPVLDTLRGEAVQRVEVSFVDLKVDIDGGNTTLQVNGDRQLFYFQQGETADGEDPARWYFVDWEDQGNSSGKPTRAAMQGLRERIQTGGVVPASMSEVRAFLATAPDGTTSP